MTYDGTWSQPERNWQPNASFREAATPPLDGPTEGSLVQLPCINVDWLSLVLGAVDQLRNPSTWLDTLSDSALETVLGRADYLRSVLAGAVNVPCCNVEMRLTSGCELQFSTDGGVTWATVAGWDTYIRNCVQGWVPPVPPYNPPGLPVPDQACNRAGFIAQKFLQICMQDAYNALHAGQTVLDWFKSLATDIAAINSVLEFMTQFANEFFGTVQAQPIADVQTAAGDPSLWQLVTCAIYSAIEADGYVTPGNFAQVATNLAGIAYVMTWVPPLLHNAWNNLGINVIETVQTTGVLEGVDCSGCGSWDVGYVDPALGTKAVPSCTGCAVYGSGAWLGQSSVPGGISYMGIHFGPAATAYTATGIEIELFANGNYTGTAYPRAVYLTDASFSTILHTISLPSGLFSIGTKLSYAFPAVAGVRGVGVQWTADSPSAVIGVSGFCLTGNGTNPDPSNPCPL